MARFVFVKGKDGRPIARLPSGKIVLPARGFSPQIGEEWEVEITEKDRYCVAYPLKRIERVSYSFDPMEGAIIWERYSGDRLLEWGRTQPCRLLRYDSESVRVVTEEGEEVEIKGERKVQLLLDQFFPEAGEELRRRKEEERRRRFEEKKNSVLSRLRPYLEGYLEGLRQGDEGKALQNSLHIWYYEGLLLYIPALIVDRGKVRFCTTEIEEISPDRSIYRRRMVEKEIGEKGVEMLKGAKERAGALYMEPPLSAEDVVPWIEGVLKWVDVENVPPRPRFWNIP